MKQSFIITRIHRQDLEDEGFDTSKVDDDTMKILASEMENAYCDKAFWEDLKLIAEELKIPKLKNNHAST